MADKMNILNGNMYFLAQKSLNYGDKLKGNSINNSDFFKFIISFRGGHCDYSPRTPENPSYAIAWTIFQLPHSSSEYRA
jgi:hypothetical protein